MRVYVAAHHDDVLLSLPQTLHSRGAGEAVIVVFSDESEQAAAICTELHRDLGLAIHALGLPEALRRGVSLRECFKPSRALPLEADGEDWQLMQGRLDTVLDRLRPAEVVVSLLNIHIDHALARMAVENWARRAGARWMYYEDQPYAAIAPVTLARESSTLRRAGPRAEEKSADIGSLFRKLEPLVSERDLNRILRYRRAAGAASEALWEPASPGGGTVMP